jgi:hypothetical protein
LNDPFCVLLHLGHVRSPGVRAGLKTKRSMII